MSISVDQVIDQYEAAAADHEARFLRLACATEWTAALVARWQTRYLGRSLGARAAASLFKLSEKATPEQRRRIDRLLARRRNPGGPTVEVGKAATPWRSQVRGG